MLQKGEVIVYLNQPICSVFHAASGGQTDDSINVWNVNVPYLRAVEDKEEQSPISKLGSICNSR